MRLLLFGDGFGIPQLLRLIPQEHVCGLVAAANRPQYHEELQQWANKHRLPFTIQPLHDSESYAGFRRWVEKLEPDLIWVNSYSMIVRDDVLTIPRLGGINIHGALLPQYRGCNPTQWAILNGETETGVTLHEMIAGLDEGDIIDYKTVPLHFEDTWRTAQARLAEATDQLIAENLPKILHGQWKARPQASDQAVYHRRRTPEDGYFKWEQPVIEIYNLVRALVAPHPGAFYRDVNGNRIVLDNYLSPTEITARKYGDAGGWRIQGEQVRLRPLCREDGDLLNQLITNNDLFIFNSPFKHVSQADRGAWTESMLAKRSDLVLFVIVDIATKRAIGACQVLNINWVQRSAELQARIGDAEAQEKGLESEAIKLLSDFGFKELNLNRIYLHIPVTNEQVIRGHEKSGFVREGVMRHATPVNGKFVDVLCMALLKHANE